MEPTKKRKTSFLKRKEPLSGRILAGKYRYWKVLGTGGMGEVHLVSDVETGQKLAMKCCIEESMADRFEREVLAWIKLNRHPNLVRAIYFDRIDAIPTLFIEYVEGTSLKAVIEESAQNKKDIAMKTVLDYAIQIARGMAHLHSHGIIHRDLKPSNILIAMEKEGSGRIKITDMGLSKLKGAGVMETTGSLSDDIVLPDITNTKDMLGTPQYMSPQQYAYSKGVAEETDIYAFGVIFYEMLTQGKRPFEEVSSQGWFYAHTFKTPTHVKRQVSSRFAIFHRKSRNDLYDLVMQCLSKKVSERPQTFKEIEGKLTEFYEKLCGESYSRDRYWKAGVLSYEDLNNRAVSLLEMGGDYVKEGWEKLGKVSESFPDGIEANLNRLLYELKTGQCSLHHFWHQGRKILGEKPQDRHKIIATMIGAALEKGSYYRQSLELLSKVAEEASSLIRLGAKLLYLGGNYQESCTNFQNLAERECCLLEDFYHWAGAVTQLSLRDGKSRLCIDQNKFSVELDRATKQQVWYILRRGEDICGTAPYLERSKDVAVGSLTPIDQFWHETEALCTAGGKIHCAVVTADQKWALSGCDAKVVLWNLEKRQELWHFEGHTDVVTGVAVDWEGRYGASGAKDGTVHIWDLKGQKPLECFEHRAAVTQVAINSDKRLAVSSAVDGTVKVWNFCPEPRGFWKIFARKQRYSFAPGCGEISAIAIGLDARYLLAGCRDGSILRWELSGSGKPIILRGHLGPVTRIAVSADGKWAISSSNSPRDNIFIWDLETAEKHMSLSVAKNGIFSMAVAGNAHWIFAASDDSSIYVWDIKYARQQVAILEGHTGTICDLNATFQGDLVLSCGTDGSIRIWKNDYIWPLIRGQKYLKVVGT